MKRALLPVVLLVAVLGGCTPASDPVAEPTPSASATATPTPTPTSTPEPTGPPALGELVIADGGVSGFVIGMDPAALNPVTAFMERVETTCSGDDVVVYWADIFPERPLGNDVRTVEALLTEEGTIAGLNVAGPGPQTAAGIGVGSSLAEMLQAYPNAALASTNVGRDRYAIDLGGWALAIDVNNGDERWPDRVPDSVAGILILASAANVGRPSFHSLVC